LESKHSRKIRNKRLRIFFYVLSIVVAFLIQTSVFPLIPFLAASPNLLLILTFSFGFLHGNLPGMIYGLGAGLLMDLFYSGPFGFYTLIFITIGYANGFFSKIYYEEYITLPMVMCVISELIYHLYIYVFRFLIRGKLSVGYYVLHIVLPSLVFSLMVTLVLYRFFFTASRRMNE
jgi:rod shape-determining protein MreD